MRHRDTLSEFGNRRVGGRISKSWKVWYNLVIGPLVRQEPVALKLYGLIASYMSFSAPRISKIISRYT
jgi:hypothetical protein